MALSAQLRTQLSVTAQNYAENHGSLPITVLGSAVIFENLSDSFCEQSYEAIQENPLWVDRTEKTHSQVPNTLEMQSSNSSDALLMSIFCHPQLSTWGGVQNILGFAPVTPEFGLKARVEKLGTNGDETEIDLSIGDCFAEAKLTEGGFTDKPKSEVERYNAFSEVFHADSLEQDGNHYRHYQVIRNVLAAVQHNKDHILLCDQRRPDLVRDYMKTIACIQEVEVRRRCRVVFWQEIAQKSGETLRLFLKDKYGIF